MRWSKSFLSGVILVASFCSASFAATATGPNAASRSAPQAPAVADCQKLGSDVSALIDTSARSPNIAAAKAVFQRGIMECMEGDDLAANTHYSEAAKLLGKVPQQAAALPKL